MSVAEDEEYNVAYSLLGGGETPTGGEYGQQHRPDATCWSRFPWPVVILATLFLGGGTGLPFYNKLTFNGKGSIHGFPHPLTASAVQVLAVSLVLVMFSCVRHLWSRHREPDRNASWVFGEHFMLKLKYIVVPGLMFGAVISLSNIGLYELDVNTHVLLRSTEIVWVVLLAWLVQGERPTVWVVSICAILVAGVVMVSVKPHKAIHVTRDWGRALAINLSSALASAIMTVAMRWSWGRLEKETTSTPSVLEVTSMKMCVAGLAMVLPSIFLERGSWSDLATCGGNTLGVLAGGVAITLTFQSSHVGLTYYSLATTVGVLGECKL